MFLLKHGPVRGGCGATAVRARSSAAAQQGPRRAMPQGSLDLCFQYCCSCGGQPRCVRAARRLASVAERCGCEVSRCSRWTAVPSSWLQRTEEAGASRGLVSFLRSEASAGGLKRRSTRLKDK